MTPPIPVPNCPRNARAGAVFSLLLVIAGCAAVGGDHDGTAAGSDLDVLRSVAADARHAWLVQPERERRIALADDAVARIRAALTDCEATDPAYTTPPWPETVVVVEDSRGRRYAFQLVALHVRTDAESPYAPSLRSLTNGEPDVSVHDCHPGNADAEALWAIHRRHLGRTEVKEYHPAVDSPVDGLLE